MGKCGRSLDRDDIFSPIQALLSPAALLQKIFRREKIPVDKAEKGDYNHK
jgi:hypothetical protein